MNLRLLLNLTYLTLLFGIVGWIFASIQHFEGTLWIQLASFESLVVRPAGTGFLGQHRAIPADLLDFDNPHAATWLPKEDKFDAVTLPFRVHLVEVDLVAPRPEKYLLMSEPTSEETSIKAGSSASIAGMSLNVESLTPWSGLIYRPGAQPMAMLEFTNSHTFNLMLGEGTWIVSGDAAGLFNWYPTREEAATAAATFDITKQGRWGVREGERVHWFDSFSPGTGLVLENGDEVTLASPPHQSEDGKVQISVEEKTTAGTRIIKATPTGASSRVEFVYPAASEIAVVLFAWREGAALTQFYTHGSLLKETELRRNASLDLEPIATTLRLVDLFPSAVPVGASSNQALELRIHGPHGPLALREGLVVPYGPHRLRFRRLAQAPEAAYHFKASLRDKTERAFSLGDQSSARVGDWTFRLHENQPPDAKSALVVAQRGAFKSPRKILAAGSVVAGAYGLVLVRFWKRRRKSLQ